MPKNKKMWKNMIKTYGREKGEEVYYATEEKIKQEKKHGKRK